MVELAPTIIVPLLPLLVISPPALFVIVLPVSLSLKIIALLDELVLIEVIWPLFSIVVLSPPVPEVARIVFPGDVIIPPLLFVIVIPPLEPLRLIAFELLPLAPKAWIVPELVIVNSPPSESIVLLPVDVTDEPECIVSVVPVTSLSVFLTAFWPVLVMEALLVTMISTSSAVTTCWVVTVEEIVVSSVKLTA